MLIERVFTKQLILGLQKMWTYLFSRQGVQAVMANQGFSYLLHKGLTLYHVERDIKEYLKTNQCRRKTLLKHFGSRNITISGPLHTCSDNRAQRCHCNIAECSTYTFFGVADSKNHYSSVQKKRKSVNHRITELKMAH